MHSVKEEGLLCDTCGAKGGEYKISEVAPEAIEEQRERYNQQKRTKLVAVLGHVLSGSFSPQTESIIESDAGQKSIDEQKSAKREEAKRTGKELLADYNENYRHLRRNEKCSCGSGKKFKHCHLIEFRKYLNI